MPWVASLCSRAKRGGDHSTRNPDSSNFTPACNDHDVTRGGSASPPSCAGARGSPSRSDRLEQRDGHSRIGWRARRERRGTPRGLRLRRRPPRAEASVASRSPLSTRSRRRVRPCAWRSRMRVRRSRCSGPRTRRPALRVPARGGAGASGRSGWCRPRPRRAEPAPRPGISLHGAILGVITPTVVIGRWPGAGAVPTAFRGLAALPVTGGALLGEGGGALHRVAAGEHLEARSSLVRRQPSASGISAASRTSWRDRRTAMGEFSPIRSASEHAASSTSSRATTRLTRPSAARAGIDRVAGHPRARARVASGRSPFGRRISPPAAAMSPRCTSGIPNRAVSAAITRSHESTISNPPREARDR